MEKPKSLQRTKNAESNLKKRKAFSSLAQSSLRRRTKIVVTVGPATRDEQKIRDLILAGANIFRLNFSHGTHDEHLKVLKSIRKISEELGICVAVLQDLSGPKLRISNVTGNIVELVDKSTLQLRKSDGSDSNSSCIYTELVDPVPYSKVGHEILLSDGMICLEVIEAKEDHLLCSVKKGGRLRSRAGVAFPDANIDLPATTEKDLVDLEWGIKNEIDYVAISFVQNAEDLNRLRKIISKANGESRIIAKIERKIALENIYEILDAADGLMIARGDLGLELPLEKVPMLQKSLIEQSNYRGVPVIVATQMLHSMVTSLRPTRAEVTDIANAVMTGADAIMLSEETAIGEHPVECVNTLHKIAVEAEQTFTFNEYKLRLRDSDSETVPDAVAYAACAAANKVNAGAIIACTETGTSARLVAKYRPQQPLYATAVEDSALRRMCLFWGVVPISSKHTETHQDEVDMAMSKVQELENFPNGTLAVITGGMSTRTPGSTSIMDIREFNFED
ncbi:MAG: pyruvate kinase [Bdellovibrionales bacterium]|nr:pyruvate kinase [Bdellovibrionales bacterium]